uniref:Uncharacterized protein n=1 Tax=Triticum urartu TaxID=4572 RepID=A0A8R7P0H7_TRIUA
MPRSAISRHRRRENRPSEQVASTKHSATHWSRHPLLSSK